MEQRIYFNAITVTIYRVTYQLNAHRKTISEFYVASFVLFFKKYILRFFGQIPYQ